MAAEGRLGDLGPVLVDQRERRAIDLAAVAHLVPLEGDEADRRRHDDEDTDEDIAHHGGRVPFEIVRKNAVVRSEAPGGAVLQPAAERRNGAAAQIIRLLS